MTIKLSELAMGSNNSMNMSVTKTNETGLAEGEISVSVTMSMNTYSATSNPTQESTNATYRFKGTPAAIVAEAEETLSITGVLTI